MINEDPSENKVELSEPYKTPGDETASAWAHVDTDTVSDSRTIHEREM